MATTARGQAQRRSDWRQRVEPWYLSYALLGATFAGLVPILLPLAASRQGSAANVGLVMAMLNLGGLSAPLWGGLADRYRLHRWLLASGLLATAAGLLLLALSNTPALWLILALIQGIGAAAVATVANLFIVEVHPKDEWDERIAWLQTSYGAGQVAGLLLAGVFSQTHLTGGLVVAAALTAVAIPPGWLTTKTAATKLEPRPIVLHPVQHGEWAIGSPQRHFHHLRARALRSLGGALPGTFGLFLVAWFLSFAGAAAVFSLYPVIMQKVYGTMPNLSSMGFAVAAALGLLLYSPAGRWSVRFGGARILRTGLIIRIIAFVSLFVLGQGQMAGTGLLALAAFVFVVLAWSLLSVSGTVLTAGLAPQAEGEAMGLFNATSAVAGVAGAALGGALAARWGYNAPALLAAVGVTLGLLLTLRIGTRSTTLAKKESSIS